MMGYCRYVAYVLGLVLCLNQGVYADHRVHPQPDTDSPMVFGVAPFMSPLALVKRLAPLRRYLSERTGHKLSIETAADARTFSEQTVKGRYDIVLTNPTFAAIALDSGNHRLLASQAKSLYGMLVVRKNSGYQNIGQLAGKTIGSPPEVGFLGQLIQPYLASVGLKGDRAARVKYFHSHNDSTTALRIGKTDAAFIAGFMWQHLVSKGYEIRELARSPEFPGLVVLSSDKIRQDISDDIKQALLELGSDDDSRQVLKKISMPRFREIEPAELDVVRPYLPL